MDLPINQIICGDCPEVMADWPDNCADLVFFSPPYNCGKEYIGSDDERPWPEYYKHIKSVIREAYRILEIGGTIAINVPPVIKWQPDHKYASTWTGFDSEYKWHRGSEKRLGKARIEPIGLRLQEMMWESDIHVRENIVWVKGQDGQAIASGNQMGCDSDPYLRGCHELILLGSKDRWFHRGGTGRRGKEAVPYADFTKDVWFLTNKADKRHPATFPLELPARLITLFTHADNSIILDPFCGSGTTPVAAKMLGRRYIGIDISEEYCEITRQRLEAVDDGVPVKEKNKGQAALFPAEQVIYEKD